LGATFFGFFPLLPTLVGYTLFFEVGWLKFFLFDLHDLSYFVHKIWMLWEQNRGLLFKKFYILHYKGSLYVKVNNFFLLVEMHYNCTFSKMVHGWKRSHPFLGNYDSTLMNVNNLHDSQLNENVKNV
jgi:hypothetical protein